MLDPILILIAGASNFLRGGIMRAAAEQLWLYHHGPLFLTVELRRGRRANRRGHPCLAATNNLGVTVIVLLNSPVSPIGDILYLTPIRDDST
jgi:hypothetical protein